MKTNGLSTICARLTLCLLGMLTGLCPMPSCRAQAVVKMSKNDLINAANKEVTTEGMSKQSLTLAINGQSISSPAGKYGIMFWNVPIYTVYLNRLEDNIDVLISTLNEAYPQRAAIIDKVMGVAGGLTYGYQAAVGVQTGQPASMSNEARTKFVNSVTEALTLDFYIDSYPKWSESNRIQFLNDLLEKAAYASGQHYIAEYGNSGYMSSTGGNNGHTRIYNTAVTCDKTAMDMLSKSSVAAAIGQAVTTVGSELGQAASTSGQITPISTDINNLFRTFNAVQGDKYWKLLPLGTSVGFMLKQISGATLANDALSNEGIGSRYADETGLPTKMYPSPFALQSAKSAGSADFSGVGVLTIKSK